MTENLTEISHRGEELEKCKKGRQEMEEKLAKKKEKAAQRKNTYNSLPETERGTAEAKKLKAKIENRKVCIINKRKRKKRKRKGKMNINSTFNILV